MKVDELVARDSCDEVLAFWFPHGLARDAKALIQQGEWWFRGGADEPILQRYRPLLERAERGELDAWSHTPRARLALIIVLDQFSRSVHRGSGRAFSNDEKALSLTLGGLETGHYSLLETPWEKTFFVLPLAHSEQLENLDLAVRLTGELVREAPAELRTWFEFSANQARGHREVIARFGRHPHRNQFLGRQSTAAELDYLARGDFVHLRPPPKLDPGVD
jgi:uncharacterized protein (DUF924 family)